MARIIELTYSKLIGFKLYIGFMYFVLHIHYKFNVIPVLSSKAITCQLVATKIINEVDALNNNYKLNCNAYFITEY